MQTFSGRDGIEHFAPRGSLVADPGTACSDGIVFRSGGLDGPHLGSPDGAYLSIRRNGLGKPLAAQVIVVGSMFAPAEYEAALLRDEKRVAVIRKLYALPGGAETAEVSRIRMRRGFIAIEFDFPERPEDV